MKKLLSIAAVLFGFSMVVVDAEAARVGGGKSSGRQSNSATQSAPAQKSAPAQAAPAPAAPAPSGMSRWLGPLAGLAAGIGLASLFGNSGLGAAMGGIMMVLLLLGAGFFIYRMLTRKSGPAQTAQSSYASGNVGNVGSAPAPAPMQQPTQFTGNAAAPGSLAATIGGAPLGSSLNAASAMNPAPAQQWPADFNAAEFERQALLNFNRLQAANDAGDASTLRDFLTPELYTELEAEMKSAWGAPQKTEPVGVTAHVIDVVTENGMYVVSVRYTGQVRENGVLNPLNEVWHLEKPVSGSSGWRVSGIQQVS